jgi:hypothetical protein
MSEVQDCKSNICEKTKHIPTNYDVYEGSNYTVDDELKTNCKIMVGDTITYLTNNQEGYKKYEVVLNKDNGTKKLILIDCYEYEYGIYEFIK